MIHGELLNIEPSQVKFLFEPQKQISSTVHLSNISESSVAYKVFSTNPRKYWVQPKTGIIQPLATCDIILYMQSQNEATFDMLCMDRFLIQSMVASQPLKPGEVAAETLIKESRLVYEYKLKVVYVLPNQERALLNVRSKSSPSRKPVVEDEEWSSSEVCRADNDIKDKLSETCIGTLLKIVPSQLQFLFEHNREMSCSVRLTNISKHHVGFKVKTNPWQYSVRPNIGIVLPQATCDITVRMKAQKEVSFNMQCKDKFVLQSVIASPGATTMDINPEMFNKEAGYDIEDYTFPVIFLSPTLPGHSVNEEQECCLETSQMKDGNLSSSEVVETWFSDTEKLLKPASPGDEEISIEDMLTVKPLELKFPFKLNKRISCSLHLTNLTEKHVAFKVRATYPAKYVVQPHAGFISPQSKFDIVVILLPQMRAPPDFHIQEKFLLQCLVASPGSTSKDAMRELFNKEAALVRECKLRVSYIPSEESQLPITEGPNESSLQAVPPVQSYQSNQSEYTLAKGSGNYCPETSDAVQIEQSSQPRFPISEEARESSSTAASEEKNEPSKVSEVASCSITSEARGSSSTGASEEKNDPSKVSEVASCSITSEARGSSSTAASEEKNEPSKVSEENVKPNSNGSQINVWAVLCVVVVLLGMLSSSPSGNLVMKMIPVMMKTLLEMVSEMVGDWVVKALVIVCFQRIFGHHMNNN